MAQQHEAAVEIRAALRIRDVAQFVEQARIVGLIVAVPAVIGALIGTALQQRVPRDWLTIGLALLMIGAAVDLLLGA